MGILYLVATPIGNLDDITIRAVKTLFSVDYIACEDTRRTGQLIQNLELRIRNKELTIKDFNITKKPAFIPYYDEIEFKKVPEIIELLNHGSNIALVSDGGTPLIADPGYKLVSECIKRSIKVISIPGPSSPVCALNSSGLPTNQFIFLGFLPSVKNKRRSLLKELHGSYNNTVKLKPTVIFFESPHRIMDCLSDLQEIYGDIEISLARELTKIHEEIIKAKISEIKDNPNIIKGEIIVLLAT